MPTGYTADVATGKIDNFADFAWICARNFGACVTLRDDKVEPTRPEKFEPSDFYIKEVAKARGRLGELLSMSDAEKRAARDATQAKVEEERGRINAERTEQRARYEYMLAEVEAWEPPTEDHQGMKDFMATQLRESIDFDCGDVSRFMPDLPEAEKWFTNEVVEASRNVGRYAEEYAKEVARVASRNAWIEALATSLPAPTQET